MDGWLLKLGASAPHRLQKRYIVVSGGVAPRLTYQHTQDEADGSTSKKKPIVLAINAMTTIEIVPHVPSMRDGIEQHALKVTGPEWDEQGGRRRAIRTLTLMDCNSEPDSQSIWAWRDYMRRLKLQCTSAPSTAAAAAGSLAPSTWLAEAQHRADSEWFREGVSISTKESIWSKEKNSYSYAVSMKVSTSSTPTEWSLRLQHASLPPKSVRLGHIVGAPHASARVVVLHESRPAAKTVHRWTFDSTIEASGFAVSLKRALVYMDAWHAPHLNAAKRALEIDTGAKAAARADAGAGSPPVSVVAKRLFGSSPTSSRSPLLQRASGRTRKKFVKPPPTPPPLPPHSPPPLPPPPRPTPPSPSQRVRKLCVLFAVAMVIGAALAVLLMPHAWIDLIGSPLAQCSRRAVAEAEMEAEAIPM